MQITKRDFEIIGFVTNMKFASATDVHRKFFKIKRDGSSSGSEWYARERLRELVKEGYLNTVRYRFENRCYYVGTKHGYDLIRHLHGRIEITKPIERIDVRTFDHDVSVMNSRLLLEEFEKVSSWQSDRQLKAIYAEYFQNGGSRDAAPDGVYKSVSGKLIAFEYEIAQKSMKRYQDKIRKYVNCIRQNSFESSPKFDHVHIVCDKVSVYKMLLNFTSIYKNYFTIEMSVDFVKRFQNGGGSFIDHSSYAGIVI